MAWGPALLAGFFVSFFIKGSHTGLIFRLRDLPENRETFQFGGLGSMGYLATLFYLLPAVLDSCGPFSGAIPLQLLIDRSSRCLEVTVVSP
ncbi:hypothetical protein WKI65_22070 [Streptomyces sp. MS1.AVA.3]|uniref:hypothetical protein n=1 Tax=Streptomyces decoyicus TaxID=249567 RepID=UPI0030C5E96D